MSLTSAKPRSRSRLAATDDRYPLAQYTMVWSGGVEFARRQLPHRDVDRARDHPSGDLARLADVNKLEIGHFGCPLDERLGRQPRCAMNVLLVLEHHLVRLVEAADRSVESNASETVLGLEFVISVSTTMSTSDGRTEPPNSA